MIFGIGLPRTGTRSLSGALKILNFNGSHYCALRDDEEGVAEDFMVDNSFYGDKKIKLFTEDFCRRNRFILTHRDPKAWRTSVAAFSFIGPDIEDYRGLLQKKFDDFGLGDNLLIFNVQDEWQPLCRFLKVPIPKQPFPHIK